MLLDVEHSENIFKNKRAKRRHARPLELNSDDESKGEPTAGHEGKSEKAKAVVAALDSPQTVVRRFWILYRENSLLVNAFKNISMSLNVCTTHDKLFLMSPLHGLYYGNIADSIAAMMKVMMVAASVMKQCRQRRSSNATLASSNTGISYAWSAVRVNDTLI